MANTIEGAPLSWFELILPRPERYLRELIERFTPHSPNLSLPIFNSRLRCMQAEAHSSELLTLALGPYPDSHRGKGLDIFRWHQFFLFEFLDICFSGRPRFLGEVTLPTGDDNSRKPFIALALAIAKEARDSGRQRLYSIPERANGFIDTLNHCARGPISLPHVPPIPLDISGISVPPETIIFGPTTNPLLQVLQAAMGSNPVPLPDGDKFNE